MKTLKKVQLTLLLVAGLMIGPSIVNAQQIHNDEDGVTKFTKPGVSIAHAPVNFTHSKGDIENNLGDMPPPYFTAGKDASICSGDSHVLEGVNSTSAMTIWETIGDGVFDDPYSLNAVYTPGQMDKINGQVMLTLVILVPGDTYPYKMSDSMILILNNSCSEPYNSPQR